MNILGYLVTLANIQNFSGQGGQLQDLSVRVGKVGVLAEEIKNQPQFDPKKFSSTGFYRVGDVGKYLSKNLCEYLFKGDVDPNDEGLILTLQFKDKRQFQDREGVDGALTMFLPRGLVSDEDQQAIDQYATRDALDFGNRRRSDRSADTY